MRFANRIGIRTVFDQPDEFFWLRVLVEGEGSLEPIVGIRAVELQGVAGNEQ